MTGKQAGNKEKQTTPPSHGGMQCGDIALTKMHHVRSELATIYRQARRGQINVADASRLANILQILSRIIEGHDLEERLTTLETKLKEG